MSKVSVAKAAKLFDVSRPTLAKHLKQGKISGEKVQDVWQVDMSELKRYYQLRGGNTEKGLHAGLPDASQPSDNSLQAEINRLQAELNAEKEARALIERHLNDLRRLLPGPEKRRWWPFR